MKRVAIVARQVQRNTGAARIAHGQIRLFHRLGYEVEVISEFVDRADVRNSGGHPKRILCWPLKGYRRRLWFSKRAENRIKKGKFDLVVGHGEIFHQNVLFLHNCVHKAHELIFGAPLPKNHEVGRIHDQLLSGGGFDFIVANSQLMADDIGARYSIADDKLFVVHPGYDSNLFRAEDRKEFREKTRNELGLRDEQKLVGLITSGNFKKRNVELFLKSIAGLPPQQVQNSRFIVFGKESNVAHYKEMAARLGLADRVHFFAPTSEIQKYYHALDVFVLPALWEEFGLVVLEAMAVGLPVIVSDRVGASEVLQGESREFIFPSGDANRLSELISRLLSDSALCQRLGQLNIEAAQKCTEQKQTEKLQALLIQHGI